MYARPGTEDKPSRRAESKGYIAKRKRKTPRERKIDSRIIHRRMYIRAMKRGVFTVTGNYKAGNWT